MKLGSLTVSKQSHVYGEASGTNAYAGIVCGDEFLIADEGIQILTPGVHFDMSKKTFFDDEANTVISKIVEIGKVPVTVSSDEEFDGNSEAMSGDIDFEENLQRCICLDTRYLLFVIDKFAGCKRLIEEMDIVTK
jgi:hypothetical protein